MTAIKLNIGGKTVIKVNVIYDPVTNTFFLTDENGVPLTDENANILQGNS